MKWKQIVLKNALDSSGRKSLLDIKVVQEMPLLAT